MQLQTEDDAARAPSVIVASTNEYIIGNSDIAITLRIAPNGDSSRRSKVPAISSWRTSSGIEKDE